ncbi:class I SAM-dependent methyltransferase [Pseudomonas sp. SA3-5]|uniref:Class I SAM-dependent methyltransferase n=1 Tax=Pseudomonas aestuarii TaxID=3018340 RepID=A0ABT4XGW9_9PSED|nr:methyltransferase domain-containing protein [Pseudomonas aestuarii]MDA7087461.1 class I SAM-dependent methyltransferase [Pseudomonas aestuarii]
MDSKLQLRIQRYGWDAAASVYEIEWQQHLAPAQLALLAASDLLPGMAVIETAAGTGLITFPAADIVGPGGSVLATDISGEMVKSGNAAAEKSGLSNVTFQRMNAEALDCEDDSFDRALCALGLMYMPDPRAALNEMKRVLRPGGLASVAVWGERRNCGWAEIFPIVDSHVHSEVCPLFFGLGSAGALVSDLEAAGFTNVQERRIQSVLSFDNSKRVISAIIDGGAVALAAKRFDHATRQAVDEAFLKSVEKYRHGEGYEIPGEFVIASGTA